jgi:hypothetical protein
MMNRALIFLVILFGLTACVDALEEDKSKNTEQQRFKKLLTDGAWHQFRNISSIPHNTPIPSDLTYATSYQSHTLSFNVDGTFTSTSDVFGASNVELSSSLNITSIGRYTLGEIITTDSGLKAMSIDLDWQIDDNNTDITLDIVYIGKTSLYFGLPRKFPSCEDIEEPFFETYDVAATDESVTSESGLDVSLIGDLDEGFIGHTREGCYGRPAALDFEQPYLHLYTTTFEIDPIVNCNNQASDIEWIGVESSLDGVATNDQGSSLSKLNDTQLCPSPPIIIN